MDALLAALPALLSLLVAILPHPQEVRSPFARALLLLIGRLSLLRHGSAPGTLHVPLTKQPWWIVDRRPLARPEVRDVLNRIPIAPAAALILLFCGACAGPQLTRARLVTAQALKSQAGMADDLAAFSRAQEIQILQGARTQEEAQARLTPFRAAVDHALKLLERSHQALQEVAAALGRRPAPRVPEAAP